MSLLNSSHSVVKTDSLWLKSVSQVYPGNSAVLSDNYFTFYVIHCTAITIIAISLLSSLLVIVSILAKQNLGFSDRFPLYLAFADFLWGTSHLTGHLVLVTTEVYPPQAVATALSVSLWFALGYQEITRAGLATYTYFKVVHARSISLGKGEWKLHTLCFGLTVLTIAVLLPCESFGSVGYWFLHDVQTPGGIVLGFIVAILGTLTALSITFGYWSIKKAIVTHNASLAPGVLKESRCSRHVVASQCLTTYVRVSVAFYCPLALMYWILMIEICFGVLEPTTVFAIVLVSSCSGWGNAMGYFYNQRLKESH